MEGDFEYQASPDVEITLTIMRGQQVLDEVEANINISRTVLELKQSLSKPLNLSVEHMQVLKDNVLLADNTRLLDYEISTDDNLVIQDTS